MNFQSIKRKKKFMKYIKIEWNQSIIPCYTLNFFRFRDLLLNIRKFHKISLKFLFNSVKLFKIYCKFLLKWQGKVIKYLLNFNNFCLCREKWANIGQISSRTRTKVQVIYQNFFQCFTFGFNKISFHFVSFGTKIF